MADLSDFFYKLADRLLKRCGLSCRELMNICPRWGIGKVEFPCPCYWLCCLAEKIIVDQIIAGYEIAFAEMLRRKVDAKWITPGELGVLALIQECLEEGFEEDVR